MVKKRDTGREKDNETERKGKETQGEMGRRRTRKGGRKEADCGLLHQKLSICHPQWDNTRV